MSIKYAHRCVGRFAIFRLTLIVFASSLPSFADAGGKSGREIIATPLAPVPAGPYSQAVRVEDTLFVAGQIAIDPKTDQLLGDASVAEQTRRVLTNIQAIVQAAGFTLADVVSTTVYLQDVNDFDAMNAVYATFFGSQPPARATVQVARVPKDAKVEISAIAVGTAASSVHGRVPK